MIGKGEGKKTALFPQDGLGSLCEEENAETLEPNITQNRGNRTGKQDISKRKLREYVARVLRKTTQEAPRPGAGNPRSN